MGGLEEEASNFYFEKEQRQAISSNANKPIWGGEKLPARKGSVTPQSLGLTQKSAKNPEREEVNDNTPTEKKIRMEGDNEGDRGGAGEAH